MTPTRQLPACELIARNILIPFFHPAERDHLPVNYHLQLLILDRDALDRLAIICRKRAAAHHPNPLDNRGGNLDYLPTNKERVNTLRHTCLNRSLKTVNQLSGYHGSYENLVARINAKGIDVAQRCFDLKMNVLSLIAAYYPHLGDECRHQAFFAAANSQGTSQ